MSEQVTRNEFEELREELGEKDRRIRELEEQFDDEGVGNLSRRGLLTGGVAAAGLIGGGSLLSGLASKGVSERQLQRILNDLSIEHISPVGTAAAAGADSPSPDLDFGGAGGVKNATVLQGEQGTITSLTGTDLQYNAVGIDGFGYHPRTQPRAIANKIRYHAGVQPGITVGVESGISTGLSDPAATVSAAAISITSEADASSAAASGSGTENDPYIIKDKEIIDKAGEGFRWDDSNANYWIKLKNCEIADNSTGFNIFVQFASDGGLIVEDCKFYGGATNAPDTIFAVQGDVGSITFHRVHFAGNTDKHILSSRLASDAAGTMTLKNCLIDDAVVSGVNNVFRDIQMHTTMEHCEITPSTQFNRFVEFFDTSTPSGTIEVYASIIKNIGWVVEGDGSLGPGSIFRNIKFQNIPKSCLALDGSTLPNGVDYADYEVGYCEFRDVGRRCAVIMNATNDPSTYDREDEMGIHHCWSEGKATSISVGAAGGEPFMTIGCVNVHITDSWVSKATGDTYSTVEDAFEHSGCEGCDIWRCVGDDVRNELVDFNNGGSAGAGSAAYIYGDCGGEAFRIAGNHGGHFHHIHVATRGDSDDGHNSLVRFFYTPEDILFESPISVENIDGDLFRNYATGTRIAMRYLDKNGNRQQIGTLPTWADDTFR